MAADHLVGAGEQPGVQGLARRLSLRYSAPGISLEASLLFVLGLV
jgi:hypothetical protein